MALSDGGPEFVTVGKNRCIFLTWLDVYPWEVCNDGNMLMKFLGKMQLDTETAKLEKTLRSLTFSKTCNFMYIKSSTINF